MKMKRFASDLDGTLLPHNGTFFDKDIAALHELGEKGVVRVIATGRSLHFSRMAIPADFPIDYLIFSSGAGIVRWPSGELLNKAELGGLQTSFLITYLQDHMLSFMIHKAIPAEHCFYYYSNNHKNGYSAVDYARRLANHEKWGTPLASEKRSFASTQALAFIQAEQERFDTIASGLQELKVIRTSSPLGSDEIWVEIFPKHVSKGAAVTWLCNELEISLEESVGLGNDYNDLDLLNATAKSYVVGSAPVELKKKFDVVPEIEGVFTAAKLSF